MINQKTLKKYLVYEEKTGQFKWRVRMSDKVKVGDIAGCVDSREGYRLIRILGTLYRASRLAWLYKYGVVPKLDIDHINHNRSDDRIENLREVSRSVNMRNGTRRSDNKSGTTGVSWSKSKDKWRAVIMVDKKYKHIGYFLTKSEAISARKKLEPLNQYHKNHGQDSFIRTL